jgi:putative hydrolase of the HAD superfamily
MAPELVERSLTLLIDADDTLWENNIYFLEVTERFLEAVSAFQVDLDEARQLLIETERRNIPVHGYGSRAFAISLVEAYQSLVGLPDAEVERRLRDLAHGIFERDKPELRPDVEGTLQELSLHHRLILVTKGDPDEQQRKVERSGLARYFEAVVVVPEKTPEVYLRIVGEFEANPATTWMIGNSPRSDINPALEAGLNAILVPHPWSWRWKR